MSNRSAALRRPTPRFIRIRHRADAPPRPLGCRWCGHPPYAHDPGSLPHRRLHQWEHPTTGQVRARLDVRRRLGFYGAFPAGPPARPTKVHPPAGPRLARHQQPVTVTAPHGRGRAPDLPPPTSPRPPRHQPYRREVTA